MDYKIYQKTIPKDFLSDGCTLAPDGTWGKCCIIHDHARREGVMPASEADKMLYDCMKDRCNIPLLPQIYYFWVRLQSTTGISPIGMAMGAVFITIIGAMIYFSSI